MLKMQSCCPRLWVPCGKWPSRPTQNRRPRKSAAGFNVWPTHCRALPPGNPPLGTSIYGPTVLQTEMAKRPVVDVRERPSVARRIFDLQQRCHDRLLPAFISETLSRNSPAPCLRNVKLDRNTKPFHSACFYACGPVAIGKFSQQVVSPGNEVNSKCESESRFLRLRHPYAPLPSPLSRMEAHRDPPHIQEY